ncbi:MAG: YceD family protein [Bryobacteraceae bacterium]
MFLSIKEMELRKIRFDETFAPGDLNFEEDEIRQAGPLHAEGTAELLANTEGEVRIQGRLTVEMETECDRCLGRALFPLDARFDLFYRPAVSVAGQDEVEIDEGEAQLGFYQGGGMELEDVLREQILLVMPMQRICREDCKGICPTCGANRNETPCGCKPAPADARWGALQGLKDLKTL